MMNFYNTNPDFKDYVDKYCTKHQIGVEEALEHKLVKEVSEYYKEFKVGSRSVQGEMGDLEPMQTQ